MYCTLKNLLRGYVSAPTTIKNRIPDHLTCLLRNLYAGQEAAVRTGIGKKKELDIEQQTGSKSGKEYIKTIHIVTVYFLFNLYAEYIM